MSPRSVNAIAPETCGAGTADTGFDGLGVHEKPAAADVLAEDRDARDRVEQERGTKSTAFVVDADTESGEQRDWLWIAAAAAP